MVFLWYVSVWNACFSATCLSKWSASCVIVIFFIILIGAFISIFPNQLESVAMCKWNILCVSGTP